MSCVRSLSSTLHTVVTCEPGRRFWPFQWAEMGVFLPAALALSGVTVISECHAGIHPNRARHLSTCVPQMWRSRSFRSIHRIARRRF